MYEIPGDVLAGRIAADAYYEARAEAYSNIAAVARAKHSSKPPDEKEALKAFRKVFGGPPPKTYPELKTEAFQEAWKAFARTA